MINYQTFCTYLVLNCYLNFSSRVLAEINKFVSGVVLVYLVCINPKLVLKSHLKGTTSELVMAYSIKGLQLDLIYCCQILL